VDVLPAQRRRLAARLLENICDNPSGLHHLHASKSNFFH
jgi:hypothetical protein